MPSQTSYSEPTRSQSAYAGVTPGQSAYLERQSTGRHTYGQHLKFGGDASGVRYLYGGTAGTFTQTNITYTGGTPKQTAWS